MRIIIREETDPYFNIAAEEYLLKHSSEDYFMLWRNDACIVVGKHQNTLAEIDYAHVREAGLPVVRRISGGGTVYHDPGNVNFSFIANGDKEKLVDFKRFTNPIIQAIDTLGISARFEGRNNLAIDGKKISGNAEHVYRNRVLHHGTLLYNANLGILNRVLKQNPNYADMAVKSIPSQVTNISAYMKIPLGINEFIHQIMNYMLQANTHARVLGLSDTEKTEINRLADEKYRTWEWNFGYSPPYRFSKQFEMSLFSDLERIKFDITLNVIQGIIQDAALDSFPTSFQWLTLLQHRLAGVKHQEAALLQLLATSDFLPDDIRDYPEKFVLNMF